MPPNSGAAKYFAAGCCDPLLAAFHADHRMLHRHYAYEHGRCLVPFLSTLLGSIALEAVSKGNLVAQEAFITRTLLVVY